MSEQEHMNRGFLKEKLGSYRVDPPEKVWDAVSEQLGQGRKRRGMYILLLATAASIALAIGLGIRFFGPDLPAVQSAEEAQGPGKQIEEAQSVVSTEEPRHPETRERSQTLAIQERIVQEETHTELSGNYAARTNDQEQGTGIQTINDAEIINEQESINDPEVDDDLSETAQDPEPELLPDTAMDMNPDPFPVEEPDNRKKSSWMVGAAFSPLYSYRDADAMAMPAGPDESGLLSYSTGVHVRYRRNSRLSIETGIYYNRTGIEIGASGIRIFSQSSDNFEIGVGSESADINTVNNSVGNIVAHSGDIYVNGYKVSAENGRESFDNQDISEFRIAESGIQQHLDFLELPFNVRYSVIDRSFELQLVGGLSTNFLVGSSVTREGPSGREEIGYLSNLNTVNYSGNAGLGMIYHMGRKMSLFLEPRFRYFLNSVNDATLPATRPYSIGFYTGLSYTF